MKKNIFISVIASVLLLPRLASAHCPLCTAGAGAAVITAKWLGLSNLTVGIFLGAFAAAMGYWMSKLIRKKFSLSTKWHLPIILITFLLTVLPIMPLVPGYTSYYLHIAGDYGSILNRTYLIHLFLLGSLLGGLTLVYSPKLSRSISKVRNNKIFPFQGVIITFTILIGSSALIEFLS